MNLVRCDVQGCLAEFEVFSHEGPIPAGWRRESKLRVMLVPREALPPLPPGVLLCPLPPLLKATVAVSARAADKLDQRDQVWRVERVPEDHPSGAGAGALHDRNRDGRRTGGDQGERCRAVPKQPR